MRKQKLFILVLGVVLYFIATMNKVLVPAAILEELLGLGTLSVVRISALGGAFWYGYAGSQLLAGIFSDRYGGVRILLIGAALFSFGTLLFPLTGNFYLMFLGRLVAGVGGGAVFLGVAKLTADLFSERFAMVLGIILFTGFLGIPCSTTPMIALVNAAGWRFAMLLPGIIALAILMGIALSAKGTIQPVRRGNALLPLLKMLKNAPMMRLCIGSSVLFGVYYLVLTLTGQKSLSDLFGMDRAGAARVLMLITIFVAAVNVVVAPLLKLCGNRRRVALFLGCGCSLVGVLLGVTVFCGGGALPMLLCSYFLLAVPGGFFPLFSTVGKELSPPEDAGLAVALVNFSAALCIALFQNAGGAILGCYPMAGTAFPSAAYRMLFLALTGIVIAATVLLARLPETGKRRDQR